MARAKELHDSNHVIGTTMLNNWLKTLNGKSVKDFTLMPMFHKGRVEVWAFCSLCSERFLMLYYIFVCYRVGSFH